MICPLGEADSVVNTFEGELRQVVVECPITELEVALVTIAMTHHRRLSQSNHSITKRRPIITIIILERLMKTNTGTLNKTLYRNNSITHQVEYNTKGYPNIVMAIAVPNSTSKHRRCSPFNQRLYNHMRAITNLARTSMRSGPYLPG